MLHRIGHSRQHLPSLNVLRPRELPSYAGNQCNVESKSKLASLLWYRPKSTRDPKISLPFCGHYTLKGKYVAKIDDRNIVWDDGKVSSYQWMDNEDETYTFIVGTRSRSTWKDGVITWKNGDVWVSVGSVTCLL